MKFNPAVARSVLLVAAAVVLLLSPGINLPYLDRNADSYFSMSMTKAGVAYGVCRAVNASVSIIKESQIQIEPAGLGVSLAAGQVLDPLDDMTERASTILVTAIVSLGIQKIAHELGVSFAPFLIGSALLIFAGLSFVKGGRAAALRGMVLKSIVLVGVARLCLPTASIVSGYLSENYFDPQIVRANDELSVASPALERLRNMRMPQAEGVLGTVKSGFNFVGEKTSDLNAVLESMIKNTKDLVANLLRLSYLYVTVFIVQVIALPLGTFWILAKLASVWFGPGAPHARVHFDATPNPT